MRPESLDTAFPAHRPTADVHFRQEPDDDEDDDEEKDSDHDDEGDDDGDDDEGDGYSE